MALKYEEDIRIDEEALDVEWLEQADLALKYGRHVAQLRRKVRFLEEKKKTIRSEFILKVNEDPQGLIGKAKPNANDIEAFYRDQKAYKEAVNELNDVYEELELAEVAKNEISFTRKKALENLVVLHGQMYFAGPKMPRDIRQEAAKFRKGKEVSSTIGKSMKRKK